MKPDEKPNIVLIMTDQHRGDCLGINGHPIVQTPMLDWLGASGINFTRAYSACPVCIPARRTFLSGQKASTHGVVQNHRVPMDAPTLPQILQQNGYQTFLSGKLHLFPFRKAYGFESMMISDGPGYGPDEGDSDYLRYLSRQPGLEIEPQIAGGVPGESHVMRPWHLEERHHVANWATSCAIDYLQRLDPTRPFFLNLSYFHPHPPLAPPAVYLERYLHGEIDPPVCGDWAKTFESYSMGEPPFGWRQSLKENIMRQYRAAYYAQINHLDDQIARLYFTMRKMKMDVENTLFIYTSDHGEMLGDHQFTRKFVPYEGATRIPLFFRFPRKWKLGEGVRSDAPVELMDIMPTILDAVGVDIPSGVDGKSLLPLARGEAFPREYLHGEMSPCLFANTGMQFLTNGKQKYIWYPGLGREEFFDLVNDPQELHELVSEKKVSDDFLRPWREKLIQELKGRPEKFVEQGKLMKLPGKTPSYLSEII